MNVIAHARELPHGSAPVCAAIGFFDGVHLGHQQIIRQTITDAGQQDGVSLVITFDRHPSSIVAPAKAPRLIYSLPQKLRTIASLGVDTVLLIHFDQAFSQLSGETFIRQLTGDLKRLKSLCVGENFHFGHGRTGNVALLRKLGSELLFTVHGMASLSLDNKIVSSTRVREAIVAGRLDSASQMLGRPYSIAGSVIRGDQLGRQLGFPTANLDVTGLVLPPAGVYASLAQVRDRKYRAVLNIGYRPTLQSAAPELRVEAHLPGVELDLYGQELEIVLLGKLRDEQTFASLAALRDQIARDIARATSFF
ncbi:MAG TPA: bifunctional riboflavin kinase/FAD synthetase [Clostridia bacterium]|nr:bifunctional riboflavin kinase/FAD synthetase [Clostridia bacterium]